MKEYDILGVSKHTLPPPTYFQGVKTPNPPGSMPLWCQLELPVPVRSAPPAYQHSVILQIRWYSFHTTQTDSLKAVKAYVVPATLHWNSVVIFDPEPGVMTKYQYSVRCRSYEKLSIFDSTCDLFGKRCMVWPQLLLSTHVISHLCIALLCPAPNRRGIKRCFCLTSDV